MDACSERIIDFGNYSIDRMENVQEKLETMMLDFERGSLNEIALTDYNELPTIIGEILKTIEKVGPNPFKDM